MIDFILNSEFFGFSLTIVFFVLALILQKKTKLTFLNPIIISAAAIIVLLTSFKIDFSVYEKGGSIVSFFLTPATICFAVPLYRQINVLKKNLPALLLGILSGVLTSAACIIAFSFIFDLSHTLYVSLLPKSITTAIGIGVSEEIGGIPAVTAGAIIITGVLGAVIAPLICRIFKITDPIARGIAIGNSSHAIGTTKAFEMGEVEGAMSSLSIVISGLMTVVVVPLLNFVR